MFSKPNEEEQDGDTQPNWMKFGLRVKTASVSQAELQRLIKDEIKTEQLLTEPPE